ncbi:hypothetical protein BCV69DRAFT_311187 [Microstroma glucosiphilum]|uniref:SUN domain-containing protein n=1 Tax=Pseudomicrostroma glucosiphilum TaxID=1684307 RepID=A0A316UB38_9BASI|nr:hypothetical protein BCV69DRAFT_311187 [Pseudomicrostroma glucosiphilum]PWN22379.1 hypothetical protein BCV69DRAFT_311187 [Pseudomicrostroma glucosiphilum]
MASRSRISRAGTLDRDMPFSEPAGLEGTALDADDSVGGASTSGKRRSRVEINRRVPQQSFAYGAPSDGKTKPRSSGSNGRKSIGEGASPPPLRSQSPDKSSAGRDASEPPADSTKAAAAARYADLKARKQFGANSASISGLNLVSQSSPAPRRSARLSVASGSVDADGAEVRRKAIAEIEEDLAESSGEEDEHGNTRKSSVPPAAIASSMPASNSTTTLHGRSRGPAGGTQLNSFFLRDPGRSISPAPAEERRGQMITTSSLLRGVQRPFRDPLSPSRGDADATRSSDAGDSRSYASEEAFVQRQGQQDDRETTPPARSLNWLQNLSPWRRGIAASNGPNGHVADNAQGMDASSHAARRKPRSSQDKTYHPPKDGEEDDESSEDGDGSRSKRSRRRKSDDKGHSARGGRDDNKIWSSTKTKRSRRGRNGVVDEEGDSTLEGIHGHDSDVEHEGERGARNDQSGHLGQSTAFRNLASLHRSIPPAAYKYGSLLLAGLLLASALAPSDGTSHQSMRLPLFGRRSTYTPPSRAPTDFESFVSRLVSLESTVGALSSKSVSLAHSHEQMSLRISALELSSREVKALLNKVDVTEGKTSGLTERLKTLEDVGRQLQSQLDKVERIAANAPQAQEKAQAEYQSRVDKRLQALQVELKRNQDEMAKVKASASQAESVAEKARDALKPLLEANLPAQMPVRLDKKTGKPTIEPWFYESLKSVIGQGGGSGAGEAAVPSWENFKNENEDALRALISSESGKLLAHQRSAAGGHAIISRSDFLQVLQSEIEGIKATLEETFNRNAQEMQNDILGKVRSQQALFEESGSWSKSRGPSQQQQQRGASALPSSVDLSLLQTKDGSDPTASILALIETALETYSSDRINRADYALYSAGGRIIPSMTSPSLQFSSPGSVQRSSWLSWVPGMGSSSTTEHLRSRSPVVALHHDNSPGMCWPFEGQTGQLGIHLAQPVLVTDITLEHPHASLLFGDNSAAPKEVTVSALVERAEDQRKLAAWRRRVAQEAAKRRSSQGDEEEEEGEELEMFEPSTSSNHLHLATFAYDATSTRTLQTFPVSAEARALAIPVSVLQVRVLSNHGNQRYTCLYRVRVHGEGVKRSEEGGD